ncbi:MAG: protein-L-isoaspartate O-methyltransferase [Rhodospirillaceae bacterium]|nr:protein-L-isoaspartate O-methyltransferase [Rhodospirillaceae bacterium]
MTNFAAARHNMIESQIRTNKVTDPALLDALAALPREQFVPVERRSVAYVDEDLRLTGERYMMEPMVLARLLQAAEPSKTDVALDVGCATGYATAVLARVTATAIGLECDANLARQAGETLVRLAIDNAIVVEGPLGDGYAKHGPYDVILVDGAVAAFPAALLDQLAEGGRLVGILKPDKGPGAATLMLKRNGVVAGRTLFEAAVPYLPGFAPKPRFVF